jgi:Tfp pilus assembly protein PilO
MAALKKAGPVTIVAMLVVVALAVAFWILLLGPKRDEAAKLGKRIERAETSLAQHRAEVATAEAARKQFPVDYQRLVVLGKAVPGDDETPSLLVQVSELAERAGVEFQTISLEPESGGEAAAAPLSSPSGRPVSATEAAAAVTPLGASIGPAGLAAMPYTLTFNGNFFQMADFIKGLDSLVKSHNEEVAVDGRLVTINGFSLAAGEREFPALTATFSVTTYVTPPIRAASGGVPSSSPPESDATPASTTTGGAP